MTSPWSDQTIRLPGAAEIEVQEDGSIEVSWTWPAETGHSGLTLLVEPDAFLKILERGQELRAIGKVRSRTDAG